jgi:hypothetical protein
MFDACTKRERMSASKLGAVVALAGGIFVAQAALFEGVVAGPLAEALPGIAQLTGRVPARGDLPTFGEEIVVTAPYRLRRATAQARVAPWRHPQPATIPVNGYCISEP